jgi:N-acetylneuraminic acid mutarotase
MKKSFLTIAFSFLFISCIGQLSWLRLPDYPGSGLKGLSSFSINGKGYMGLGLDTLGNGHTDWFEYNPGTNSWTAKASLPAAGRWSTTCFVIGDKGYVVGGGNGSTSLNEVWEYDPQTNTWTSKANLPVHRENAASFSIANKGYVGTGYFSGSSNTDFYEFDPVANTWTQKSSFPGLSRNGSASFSIGNKGYIGMGNANNSSSYPLDFYEYNPINDTWTRKADFQHTLNSTVNFSTGTAGYVLCGYYYQWGNTITHNPMNMLYKYDQATDSWTLEGTFPGYPRGYSSGYIIGNDMYIGTGSQKNDIATGFRDYWKLANGIVLIVGNPNTENDFMVSPVPTNDILVFPDVNAQKFSEVRIYDVSGRLMRTSNISAGQNKIDVSEFAPGLYFLEAVTKSGTVMDSRFVKQ